MAMPEAGGWGAPAPVSWQSEADAPIRERVRAQILAIFSKRQQAQTNNRLPDFVSRLEDALYHRARSKVSSKSVLLRCCMRSMAKRAHGARFSCSRASARWHCALVCAAGGVHG